VLASNCRGLSCSVVCDTKPDGDGRSGGLVWRGRRNSRQHAGRGGHLNAVEAILADEQLTRANLGTLAYLGADTVSILASGERQLQVQSQLIAAFQHSIENAGLEVLKRSTVLSGWSEVATALLTN